MTMSSPHRSAPLRDTKSSLYEAAVAAVKSREEVNAERARAARSPKRRRRFRVALVLIGLAGGVLLLLQPTWLTGPKTVPQEPPGIAAASLRLALLRERQRVTEFARAKGHLPATLHEIGEPNPEIHFDPVAFPQGAFRLWGRTGDSLITLRSSDSLATFLGRSLLAIKNRRRK
jgi:hypothetical protein